MTNSSNSLLFGLLKKGWDPLPVPPAEELFEPNALLKGDPFTLDGYSIFANKKWDQVDLARLYEEEWFLYLQAHHRYYYASYLLRNLMLAKEPYELRMHCPIMLNLLNSAGFIDSLDTVQRVACVKILDSLIKILPEPESESMLPGLRWLQRWHAKQID